MSSLERRVFLAGLKLDFSQVYRFPDLCEPLLLGRYLLPLLRSGELDLAVAKGGI